MKFTFQIPLRFAIPALVAGLFAPVANAAQVAQAAEGHVLLAFRDTSNSTIGSYLVNLGAVSQFESAAASSTTLVASIPQLEGDLDVFDRYNEETEQLDNWHARGTVVWSAFAKNSNDNEAVYISRPRPSLATQSTPLNPRTGAQQNTAASEIGSVVTGGYNVLSSTVGQAGSASNSRGGFQLPSVNGAVSYKYQVATDARPAFNIWQTAVERSFDSGAPGSALDFYVLRKIPGAALYEPGTVTYLGYFSISTSGAVSFTRAGSNPLADDDGDGFNNGDEELAGTNPNNSSSFFRIPAPVVVANTSRAFNFPTIASRKYIIEYNDDLSGAWEQVHEHFSGAGAAPVSWTDTNPVRVGLSRGFYRARVTTP